jgi:hypothetical protein
MCLMLDDAKEAIGYGVRAKRLAIGSLAADLAKSLLGTTEAGPGGPEFGLRRWTVLAPYREARSQRGFPLRIRRFSCVKISLRFFSQTANEGKEPMNTLIDFFAVRPVFTLYGLRVLWGAYIFDRAVPFVTILSNPHLSMASITPLLVLLLQACLEIAIFRLLIEVSAAVLLGRPRQA